MEDRLYTETHEWTKIDGETATIGITSFAADNLTDITFVELPAIGSVINKGESFAEIESVKSAGEIYAPLSGEVVEINEELDTNPGMINESAFADGWIVKIKIKNIEEIEKLLDYDQYKNIMEH